nr:Dabb family protein [Edaphobacter aggregans]
MVIHTFAFRWKPGVTSDQKEHAIREIQSLQGQIPGLVETLVGPNISPRSQG